jgi:putative transposase
VTAASLADHAGARKIFKPRRGPRKKRRTVWVDGTSRGAEGTPWVNEQYPRVLASVTQAEGPKGFAVVPQRWVGERTLAWVNPGRRCSQEDEESPSTRETFVYVAMTRLMLKRLAA